MVLPPASKSCWTKHLRFCPLYTYALIWKQILCLSTCIHDIRISTTCDCSVEFAACSLLHKHHQKMPSKNAMIISLLLPAFMLLLEWYTLQYEQTNGGSCLAFSLEPKATNNVPAQLIWLKAQIPTQGHLCTCSISTWKHSSKFCFIHSSAVLSSVNLYIRAEHVIRKKQLCMFPILLRYFCCYTKQNYKWLPLNVHNSMSATGWFSSKF